MAWNPCLKVFYSFTVASRIVVDLEDRLFDAYFQVVNLYSPYLDKISFWEGLDLLGILSYPNLILGGNLKFTLSIKEVWGTSP